MSSSPAKLNGRCLCGSETFTVTAPFRPIIVCHCRQCARWTGATVPATAVAPERFELTSGDEDLAWYRASDSAARGFCRACGSSLCWKPDSGTHISILAGALDPPTGLEIDSHIFVGDKADYYEIAGEVPCHLEDTPS